MKKKLPPNQVWAARNKWPVVGERAPREDNSPWLLSVVGQAHHPKQWTLEQLQQNFSWVERSVDIHCVTRWSKPHATFGGFRLLDILDACKPTSKTQYVSFVARSSRNHSTSLTWSDVMELDPIVALTHDGAPLASIHGGPIRTVVPGKYFYKSLKWLETIELLKDDKLGYWEADAGYHNHADPWKEERYILSGLKPKDLKARLESRDLSHQNLLSVQASNRNLSHLNATHALLRNSDFRKTDLANANFQGANLSNAHFQKACLQGANFADADLEGANFCGADLRGANFKNASLFGATFCSENECDPNLDAILDTSTTFNESSLTNLSDKQQAFLKNRNCRLLAQSEEP